MKYLLGINIGSQSIRIQLYDQELQNIGMVSIPQRIDAPRPSWATQNAAAWWPAIRENLKMLLLKTGVSGKDIFSVGCTAHMHGVVPIGHDGNLLQENIQIYSDKRAVKIAKALRDAPDMEEWYHIAGNVPVSNWFGIKVRWIKEHQPEIYDRAACFLTPCGYLAYLLSGEYSMDPSDASGSFLMDSAKDEWSPELADILGIDISKLPPIRQSVEVLGTVTRKTAEETGLGIQTRVLCGAGDMLCGLYLSGLNKEKRAVDSTGTGSVLCAYSKSPLYDKRIMNLRSVMPGWVSFGENDSSGISLRWLGNLLTACGKDKLDYENINELVAGEMESREKLFFLPYLLGERTMGAPNGKGCFIGMTLATTPGRMLRAVMEGQAFDNRRILDIFTEQGYEIESIYAICGGAKSTIWNQIRADIYNRPVYTLQAEECEAMGAALLGSVEAGMFGNLSDAAEQIMKIKREYLPRKDRAKQYEEEFQNFVELHDAMQKPFGHIY